MVVNLNFEKKPHCNNLKVSVKTKNCLVKKMSKSGDQNSPNLGVTGLHEEKYASRPGLEPGTLRLQGKRSTD